MRDLGFSDGEAEKTHWVRQLVGTIYYFAWDQRPGLLLDLSKIFNLGWIVLA